MTFLGFGLLGFALYSAVRPWGDEGLFGLPRHLALSLAVFISALPDLDLLTSFAVHENSAWHRYSPLHSVSFILFVAFLVPAILVWTGRLRKSLRSVLGCCTGLTILLSAHLCIDTWSGGDAVHWNWPADHATTSGESRDDTDNASVPTQDRTVFQTQWTTSQRDEERARRQVLTSGHGMTVRVRTMLFNLVSSPEHTGRLSFLASVLVEGVAILPLVLLGLWRRRKYPPKSPPIRYRRLLSTDNWRVPTMDPRLAAIIAVLCGLVFVITWAGPFIFAAEPRGDMGILHLDGDEDVKYFALPTAGDPDDNSPLVVLIHDWRGSHETMAPLARSIAKAGLDTIRFDMPGHSSRGRPIDLTCVGDQKQRPCRARSPRTFVKETEAFLRAVKTEPRWQARSLILIGHGVGGWAALAASDSSVIGRIVIDGALQERLLRRNVLSISRPSVVARLSGKARRIGGRHSFENQDAFEIQRLNLAHDEFIRDPNVFASIGTWIQKCSPDPKTISVSPFPSFLAWWLFVCALAFAVAVAQVIYVLLARRFSTFVDARPSIAEPTVAGICLVVGLILAGFHLSAISSGGRFWLERQVGNTFVCHLFLFTFWGGMTYAAMLLFLTRGGDREGRLLLLPRPTPILAAVIAFFCWQLLCAGPLEMFAGPHRLESHRLGQACLYSLCILPFRRVLQDIGPRGQHLPPRVFRFSLRILFWYVAIAAAGVSTSKVDTSLISLLPIIIGAECMGIIVRRRTESHFSAALVVSLIVGTALAMSGVWAVCDTA